MDNTKTKNCQRCKTVKGLSEFRKDGTGHSWCRLCQNEYNREWYHKNRERGLRWRKNGNLKRTYGITLEEYEAMVAEQNGVCKICRTKPEAKHLAVDHDHTTGNVRGILCENCNRGIGMFKDSPEILANAIKYLS